MSCSANILVLLVLGVSVTSGWLTINTEKGKPCKFPFVYKDNIYHDCIADSSDAWCSLTANYDKDGQYGYCDATAAATAMKTYGGNANGAPCVFPFTNGKKEYKYCMKGSVPWCATTKDYDTDGKWGYCAGYRPQNQFEPANKDHLGLESVGDTKALSQSDRDEIVDIHNQFRNDVSPTAQNMMKLAYDVDLEMLARKWVNQCKGGHPAGGANSLPGQTTLGQNAWSGGMAPTWKAVISAWHREVQYLTFGKGRSGTTGHYTQVVWATTTRVGCALKKCPSGTNYAACNYGPSGNSPSSQALTPYVKGTAAASCKTKDSKFPKLCDCGGRSCLDGKAIDPSTCQCTCRAGEVGDQCAVDCDAFADPRFCEGQYKKNYGLASCLRFSNVAFECPRMCGICPAKA